MQSHMLLMRAALAGSRERAEDGRGGRDRRPEPLSLFPRWARRRIEARENAAREAALRLAAKTADAKD